MAAKQEAAPRSRGRQLRADALRYGIGAAALFALATVFWFFAHPLGVFILCVACAFAAVAAVYIALGAAAWRAFKQLGKSEAMPCAIVTEYGHLLLCAGSEKDARAYAEADARAYAKEYRPVGEKPSKDAVQAAKAEQKRRNEEEKRLRAALSPCRQFDRFTPADLPFLEGKRIFVSERMYGLAASKGEWEAARRSNTIETISGPALGR